jgi:gas vesicle structural protein
MLTIDARVVVASAATYLRLAEAVNRLDLTHTQIHSPSELVEGTTRAGSRGKLTGAVDAGMDKLSELAEPRRDQQRHRRGEDS